VTWFLNNQPVRTAPEQYQGFVYEIRNIATNRIYIGKKNYWRIQKLKPLKGKTRNRLKRVETDWQDYYGSNTQLLKDIEIYGPESTIRTILFNCKNKTEMSYLETKTQFELDVLRSDLYYNDFIGCRITGRGLSSKSSV
jgi:hypothetical protein